MGPPLFGEPETARGTSEAAVPALGTPSGQQIMTSRQKGQSVLSGHAEMLWEELHWGKGADSGSRVLY